jgi:hypothetical protein
MPSENSSFFLVESLDILGLNTWSRVSSFSPLLAQFMFQMIADLSAEAEMSSWSLDEK